jgi:heme/copper-type cytochrome/quinol oxidase subunit 4
MILYMLDGFLLPAGVILLVVCLALWLGNKNKKTTQEMNMTGNPDGTGNETQAGQAGAPVRNIPGTAGFIMSIVLLIAAIVMAKFNDKIHHLDVLIVVWGIFVVIGGVLSFIGVTRQSGKGLAITGIVISFVLVLALIGLMGLAMDGFK